ncbi:response regulator [Bradyrhizobium sp. CCGB01]|nr:response regulator [Bradyrhizobium sp. CCGB01]MCP3405699.1 response regulator [Bradyrhizobium sp. CCGB01]
MSMPSVISIVDDHPSVRNATNNLLTSYGYIVHTFVSADEFLNSAELRDTSCVITDVQMPCMNGLDFLGHMRSLGHNAPFIFITAFPNEAVRARAIKAGAISFLAKPFTTPTLITCLKIALEGPNGTCG